MFRLFELLLALLLLPLLAPFLLLLCLWVFFCSPGPVFFLQTRIGRHEKEFSIFKLRTMHIKSETQATGSVTTRNDPRLLRGAALVRKFKLDELPQIFNVLLGTMSLVGPRPTVREDFEKMDARQRGRFKVRPGLTGLAQISGNTSLSWPQRIEYDLAYIENPSFFENVHIILKTVTLIASGKAESHPVGDDEWED